jgi:hypothetical protein
MAPNTVRVALAGIVHTVLCGPVLITLTDSLLPAMGVVITSVTVLIERTKAAIIWVTLRITLPDILQTVVARPVLVADAVPMVVKIGVIDARFAVARHWSKAAITLVVTEALENATVLPSPPVVTNAIPLRVF